MAQASSSFRRSAPRGYDGARSYPDDAGNILSFPVHDTGGATALDLIYQAAEMFQDIEHRARDIEANARAMCQSAVDKLVHAERRAETAERSRGEIIHDIDRRLQEVSQALSAAQARIEAAEARAAAADLRAATAEAEARNACHLLTQVEDAIRDRLLGADRDVHPLRRART